MASHIKRRPAITEVTLSRDTTFPFFNVHKLFFSFKLSYIFFFLVDQLQNYK